MGKRGRKPTSEAKEFEKLLLIMNSGKVYAREKLMELLDVTSKARIARYLWDIKQYANATVKSFRNGREVVGYQLMNVAEVNRYLVGRGLLKKAEKKVAAKKEEAVAV